MRTARICSSLASLLLLATAAFHASGGAMVSGWLSGGRGEMLRALWYLPSLDWLVIALIWAFAAYRPSASLAPVIFITAILPFAAAILVLQAVGIGFPGVWMLAGSSVLAAAGASALRRASSSA